MADDGAHEIRAMLGARSDTLGKGVRTFAFGLWDAREEGSEVSAATYRSINDLRRYYLRLADRVRKVKTSSRSAKGDALGALARLDSGLAALTKGLQAGWRTDEAQVALRDATRRTERAASDLARARRRLK
jgi:hypothetical protein